jgi:hypothetical protein
MNESAARQRLEDTGQTGGDCGSSSWLRIRFAAIPSVGMLSGASG